MGQYCFVRWRLSSSSVTLSADGLGAWAVGRRRTGRVSGSTADTAQRASTVTSRYGDTLFVSCRALKLMVGWEEGHPEFRTLENRATRARRLLEQVD